MDSLFCQIAKCKSLAAVINRNSDRRGQVRKIQEVNNSNITIENTLLNSLVKI